MNTENLNIKATSYNGYKDVRSPSWIIETIFFPFCRLVRSRYEIVPLDKWEILPTQIEYGEELGQGAFGVVYKATLNKRVGIEVFNTGKKLLQEEKKPGQVVAVKVLRGEVAQGLWLKLRNLNSYFLWHGYGFWDFDTSTHEPPIQRYTVTNPNLSFIINHQKRKYL